MRIPRFPMLLAGCLAALTASAQSAMQCPAPPAGRPCEAFHYHVQLYRPDNRTVVEFYGGTSYASEAACNRAREQHVQVNQRVVEFMRANKDQKYEPDRVGACHCDMTLERSSATYLAEPQRVAQLRAAEEVRLRVRERLLDKNAPADSDLVRGLWSEPPATPILGAPKLVPLPQTPPVAITTSADDLVPTRTLDNAKPSVAALDLPLADIAPAGAPAPPPVVEAAAPPPPVAPAVVAPAPVIEERVEAAEVAEPITEEQSEEESSTDEIAERFISYETQRIQNVLRASSAITDENVKTRIFEASMERIQLLSNLRLLIEGSGVRSRLASAARDVVSEEDRLALVAKLFGNDMKSHWAPADAADVVFDVDAAVASAPERALRDTTGQFTPEQKKRALYLVLAKTQPTEEQRLWLSSVVEGFLR